MVQFCLRGKRDEAKKRHSPVLLKGGKGLGKKGHGPVSGKGERGYAKKVSTGAPKTKVTDQRRTEN